MTREKVHGCGAVQACFTHACKWGGRRIVKRDEDEEQDEDEENYEKGAGNWREGLPGWGTRGVRLGYRSQGEGWEFLQHLLRHLRRGASRLQSMYVCQRRCACSSGLLGLVRFGLVPWFHGMATGQRGWLPVSASVRPVARSFKSAGEMASWCDVVDVMY